MTVSGNTQRRNDGTRHESDIKMCLVGPGQLFKIIFAFIMGVTKTGHFYVELLFYIFIFTTIFLGNIYNEEKSNKNWKLWIFVM